MSDILAPRFDTWGLASLPSYQEVLADRSLCVRLVTKVIRNLCRISTFSKVLLERSDWPILLLPLLLVPLKMVRLRNYWFVGALLAMQFLTNAVMTVLPRYFDASIFFCLWTLARDMKRWLDAKRFPLGMAFRVTILIVSGGLLAGLLGDLRQDVALALRIRARILSASQEAHRLIAHDAFVITDFPQLWTWYGRGDFCCFVPLNHPDTMRLILEKFPRAYIVLFIPDRAGYDMTQFHRWVVPTLNTRLVILGPPPSFGH